MSIDELLCLSLELTKSYASLHNSNIEFHGWDTIDVEEEHYCCPRCTKCLGLCNAEEAEAFLKGEIEVIPREAAKVRRDFALYHGKVYKIVREEKTEEGARVLIAKRITDEPRASIIAASF